MAKYNKKKKISTFDVVNNGLIILITLVMMYPLYFCIIASFSDPQEVTLGNTLLWVKGFTLEPYKNVINEKRLWIGYRNTIIYTLLGTLYNLALTIPVAYVLSKKYLPFRKVITWFYMLMMFIGGGMIPNYLLMKSLNLVNNPLVMIIGVGISAYNMTVARQYFSASIPGDLFEAAYIDGASEFRCFRSIAMPLAKPIIAVLALYFGVAKWNNYYTGLLYLYKEKYFTLQQVLRTILITSQSAVTTGVNDIETEMYIIEKARMAQGMKYSTIFIASLPLLIIYPFLQKYFAKGVMVGSVKG